MRPTLSPEDEALVRDVRAHWVRMRDDPEGCGETPISTHCALCKEYGTSLCAGCPIVVVTSRVGCEGTPFCNTRSKFFQTRRTEPGTFARNIAVLTFQKAAQRVIDWIDENLLPEPCELKPAVVPEPEELRRIVLESVERNKESTKRIVDVICGHLPESCRLANEQQLPSEITRAAEEEEADE